MRFFQIIILFLIIVFQAGCFNAYSSKDDKQTKQEQAAVILVTQEILFNLPHITVTNIKNFGIMKSGFIIGTASDPDNKTITAVEVSIDDGPYQAATGTTAWKFQIPTGASIWKDGSEHTISVRCINADSKYSRLTILTVLKGVNCDVNGDGYQDMAVGAPGYNSMQGRVYIHHGSPDAIDTVPSKTLTGENTSDNFGISLIMGDINGDGYADCVVGASGFNSNTGRVYIYYGSADGINSATSPSPQTRDGSTTSEYFGSPLTLGDVNGDGYEDVAAGAPNYNSHQGRAYIFHGGSSGISSSADRTLTGTANSDLSTGLAIGDTNGDGYGDLAVSAPFTYTDADKGLVYIFEGNGSGIGGTATKTLTGFETGDYFGFRVTIGDIDRDGYGELVVGSPGYDTGAGRIYVYSGSISGINDGISYTPQHIDAEAAGISLGTSLALDDINGDGLSDLAVTALAYNSFTGRVYVHNGGNTGLSAAPSQTLTGSAASYFGLSLSLGDINNNGYADLVIGSPCANTNSGRVDIFPGSSDGIGSTSSKTLTGVGTSNAYGYSVSQGNNNHDNWDGLFFMFM